MKLAAHTSMLVHHLIAAFFGLRTVIVRCGVSAFVKNEDSCWGTYRPEYSMTLMITLGYFVADFIFILFLS